MHNPPKPTGVKPMVLAGWMEKPWPVEEKCAVTSPTVRSMGSDVCMGALSKSKTLSLVCFRRRKHTKDEKKNRPDIPGYASGWPVRSAHDTPSRRSPAGGQIGRA